MMCDRFPSSVGGWWKEKPSSGTFDKTVRYALYRIHSGDGREKLIIYTPIQAAIPVVIRLNNRQADVFRQRPFTVSTKSALLPHARLFAYYLPRLRWKTMPRTAGFITFPIAIAGAHSAQAGTKEPCAPPGAPCPQAKGRLIEGMAVISTTATATRSPHSGSAMPTTAHSANRRILASTSLSRRIPSCPPSVGLSNAGCGQEYDRCPFSSDRGCRPCRTIHRGTQRGLTRAGPSIPRTPDHVLRSLRRSGATGSPFFSGKPNFDARQRPSRRLARHRAAPRNGLESAHARFYRHGHMRSSKVWPLISFKRWSVLTREPAAARIEHDRGLDATSGMPGFQLRRGAVGGVGRQARPRRQWFFT